MTRKFKQWWSRILPISTKQTIVSRHKYTEHKTDRDIWKSKSI